jgi:hypothetical protein
MNEPQARSIDDLIRDGDRRPDPEIDRLSELRQRIAAEEGVPQWWEECRGGNESQIRASALTIRSRLGLPNASPSLQSAIAAQRRAQAQRNMRMNH